MSAARISVFKAWGSRTNQQWVNTYEACTRDGLDVTAGDLAVFAPLADAIAAAEQKIHLYPTQFHRWTISTWEPEGDDYNPDNLITKPLDTVGLLNVVPDQPGFLDLRMIMQVSRVATTGRPGRIMYRGCLAEAFVIQQGGGTIIDPAAAADPLRAAYGQYEALLAPFLAAGNASTVICLIGGKLTKQVVPADTVPPTTRIMRTYGAPFHVRMVSDLVLSGVTVRQKGSGYFDRAVGT